MKIKVKIDVNVEVVVNAKDKILAKVKVNNKVSCLCKFLHHWVSQKTELIRPPSKTLRVEQFKLLVLPMFQVQYEEVCSDSNEVQHAKQEGSFEVLSLKSTPTLDGDCFSRVVSPKPPNVTGCFEEVNPPCHMRGFWGNCLKI